MEAVFYPLKCMSVLSVFVELSISYCLSSGVKSQKPFSRAGGRDCGPLFQWTLLIYEQGAERRGWSCIFSTRLSFVHVTFWLCWVSDAAVAASVVVGSGDQSPVAVYRLLLLQSTGSRALRVQAFRFVGSVVVARRL